MPERVSCQLYLLLDALENFDNRETVSRDIKFSNSSRSKYNRQETHTVIIFYIYPIASCPNRVRYFLYTSTLCTYSIYLSTFDLLSFIMSNTDKHKVSSIWKWFRCCYDVMNNADCVIKRDVYPQKMHSSSKNIRGISVFVLLF